MNKDYSSIAQQYWSNEYKNLGYKVVHDAGTFKKTMILAELEMDLFLFPTKEKCDKLLNDKEVNPIPTFHDDFWIHQPITNYLGDLKNKIAVDYGCGSMARYSAALSKYFEKMVYGFDISSEAIILARQNVKQPNICLMKNSGESVPLADGSVDFIFSNLVLQHIGTKEVNIKLAKEFARILKKGGIMRLEYLDGTQDKGMKFQSVVEGNGFSTEQITKIYNDFGCAVLTSAERHPYLWITCQK